MEPTTLTDTESISHPAGEQMVLFPYTNSLTERVGVNFFRQLPQTPGVYLLHNQNGQVIYVGQSRNLRQRLNSYRYVRPGRVSGKVLRMVAQVHSIQTVICESPRMALLKENTLIRKYRPKFNKLNTHPESHVFVWLDYQNDRLSFSWTNRQEQIKTRVQVYGSFRSRTARRGLIALYRLFWYNAHPEACIHDLPLTLNRPSPPASFQIDFSSWPLSAVKPCRLRRRVKDFLEGKSETLIHKLCGKSGEIIARSRDPWLQQLLQRDGEALQLFFHHGPRRIHELKAKNNINQKRSIGQEKLDDLTATGSLKTG